MPLVQVTMLTGRTADQKRKLAQRITDAMAEDMGKPEVEAWLTDVAAVMKRRIEQGEPFDPPAGSGRRQCGASQAYRRRVAIDAAEDREGQRQADHDSVILAVTKKRGSGRAFCCPQLSSPNVRTSGFPISSFPRKRESIGTCRLQMDPRFRGDDVFLQLPECSSG